MRFRPDLDPRVARVLLALFCALVAATWVVRMPGMPPTLKADEPAYFLGALSLVHDGDFVCEPRDLERAFAAYPWLSVQNLILASDDDWQTSTFGKPWLYSALAAPFAALGGAAGMVAFNMLLLSLAIWLGALHLRRWNSDATAALVATGVFLGSHAWAYVFWLHPEVLILTSVAVALHGGLESTAGSGWRSRRWLAVSGFALAVAVYHKPMLAAFALPIALGLIKERRGKALAVWVASGTLSIGLFAAGSLALTGHATSYLGVARAGFTVSDPAVMPTPKPAELPKPRRRRAAAKALAAGEPEVSGAPTPTASTLTASTPTAPSPDTIVPKSTPNGDAVDRGTRTAGWWWIFRMPEFDFREIREDTFHFLIGRHAGLVPYQPFAVLCVVSFFLGARRSMRRWALLGALGLVAAFLLLFIPFNWHGGGGFVGNRYFVLAAPGFLYLVRKVRPAILVPIAWAVAGTLVGPLWWNGHGRPVPQPTLQSHIRHASFGVFPFEISLKEVPGYDGTVIDAVWYRARRDHVRFQEREILARGAEAVELFLQSAESLDRLDLEITSPVEGNEVVVELDGDRRVVKAGSGPLRVQLVPTRPAGERWERSPSNPYEVVRVRTRRLVIRSASGELPSWGGKGGPTFYIGARVRVLDPPADMSQSDARQRRLEGAGEEAFRTVSSDDRAAFDGQFASVRGPAPRWRS